MKTYTDASLPFLDASLAIASLIAQWLLSKKILENWIIWILVDIFSIGMYWYKELYITSGLYMIFLILATSGLISWYKAKKKQ
jgi:nicotinamide mononucleotide transporter